MQFTVWSAKCAALADANSEKLDLSFLSSSLCCDRIPTRISWEEEFVPLVVSEKTVCFSEQDLVAEAAWSVVAKDRQNRKQK